MTATELPQNSKCQKPHPTCSFFVIAFIWLALDCTIRFHHETHSLQIRMVVSVEGQTAPANTKKGLLESW